MNIGIISDLHIRLYRNNETIYPFMIQTFDYFYNQCKKRNVKKVLILGDIFNVKNTISSHLLTNTLEYFRKKMEEIEHILIPGNHDRISDEINFLKIFSKDADVVENYKYYDIDNSRLHFLPFYNDNVLKEKFKLFELSNDLDNYLFTHLSIKGFSFDNGHEDVYSDIDIETFSKYNFKRIYSGHYHSYQSIKNITYVSSPLQIKFGEKGPNGFVFLNSSDLSKYDFIENPHSPKFLTFEFKKSSLKELKKTKNSFITIILPKKKLKVDNRKLNEFKNKLLSVNYDVKFISLIENNDKITDDITIPSIIGWDSFINSDISELINEFINNIPDLKNKKKYIDFLLN